MTWNNTNLENLLHERLKEEFPGSKGDEIYSDYVSARRVLVEDILEEIRALMPSLTDHGPRHIINVLDNAYRLMENDFDKLKAIDLYVLCMSILFHDVGNIHGRESHNRKITGVHRHVRSTPVKYRKELKVILAIAGAHCGKGEDGTKDTLKDVPLTLSLQNEPVQARSLAAIVRFADELAEGPQRTSIYMREIKAYDEDSEIFHAYAGLTEIFIDKGNGRIAITYNINLSSNKNGLCFLIGNDKDCSDSISIKDMLEYIFTRVMKLDQERKYNSHYCEWLSGFNVTSISFDFWYKDDQVNIGLLPLTISDLVIPGDTYKNISDIDSSYSISDIVDKLNANLKINNDE